MKQKEIIWKEISILNCSANAYSSGKPYKKQMLQGKVFPTTKEQAIAFVSMGCLLGILNSEDVKVVEKVLNKHGLKGEYKYVCCKQYVKLINNSMLDMHQPFGWIIDVEPVNGIIPSEYAAAQCIVNVGEDFISLAPYLKATHEGNVQDNSVISGNYTYSEALKYFWFMDGTPLGIKKTENSILQLP